MSRIISLFFLFALLIIAFSVFDITTITTQAWMDNYVRNQGLYGMVLYVGLVTALTAVGIPRQLCSLLGGYVFGMWLGTLLATLGTALACLLCFSYARFLGQTWLHKKYGHKLKHFNDFLCQSPFLLTTIVRIVPLGSNFLTNFLAGISRIPALSFLAGSTLGFTVQNFIFATMGSGLQINKNHEFLLSAALYVVSLSLGYWIYWRYKNHRKNI